MTILKSIFWIVNTIGDLFALALFMLWLAGRLRHPEKLPGFPPRHLD
jgi:hypothetical protein